MSMILLEPAYKILHTTVKFKRRTISVSPEAHGSKSCRLQMLHIGFFVGDASLLQYLSIGRVPDRSGPATHCHVDIECRQMTARKVIAEITRGKPDTTQTLLHGPALWGSSSF
jgi:hypothetical protein